MPDVTPEFGTTYLFQDVFPEPEAEFAGVKAVFARMTTRYMSFSESGASSAAIKAKANPWIICIGTTKTWNPDDRGRVLNLVRLTTVVKATPDLAASEEDRGCLRVYRSA